MQRKKATYLGFCFSGISAVPGCLSLKKKQNPSHSAVFVQLGGQCRGTTPAHRWSPQHSWLKIPLKIPQQNPLHSSLETCLAGILFIPAENFWSWITASGSTFVAPYVKIFATSKSKEKSSHGLNFPFKKLQHNLPWRRHLQFVSEANCSLFCYFFMAQIINSGKITAAGIICRDF